MSGRPHPQRVGLLAALALLLLRAAAAPAVSPAPLEDGELCPFFLACALPCTAGLLIG